MSIFIHESAEVHPSAKIGDGTKIWNNVQIRENAIIGTNCNLGKGVFIDAKVKIGNSVKIQNFVSIYYGVEVEDEVFIGPNATFTNDLYPRSTSPDWEIFPTKLEFGCSIGANSTVVCGVTIGMYSMIGAGAIVTNSVLPHALMIGNPARLSGFVCKKGHPMKQTDFLKDKLILECSECKQKISFLVKDHE